MYCSCGTFNTTTICTYCGNTITDPTLGLSNDENHKEHTMIFATSNCVNNGHTLAIEPETERYICITCEKEDANADAYQQHIFETETFPSLMEHSAPMNLNECITSNCRNPVPVPGTRCPTCTMWYRAYLATDASDYFTWSQYVELMQEQAREEADFHDTCSDAEAKWLIG